MLLEDVTRLIFNQIDKELKEININNDGNWKPDHGTYEVVSKLNF